MTIMDLQKTIQEGEQKLKQQQNLYEQVLSLPCTHEPQTKNIVD